ncbi:MULTISPECIES: hypothetical protein [Microtetraspora]|uniref:Antibiotic biosynthesis monooxygenase n=1 Tax=Microtetraspora glauca TaxID=1996 RepID=A0ABV3GKI0_MICGL|nr:hypothetical protein [Microtetraspora sp. AC03309]MCC5576168.1 hypothetical protein [Microtetraspora sp. AC03309]
MGFVQVIEYETSHAPEVESLLDEWCARTAGERTATHTVLARDHQRPEHYVSIVEFPSYEEAMRNNTLPATSEFAHRMEELCDSPPRFVDLDVVRDVEL